MFRDLKRINVVKIIYITSNQCDILPLASGSSEITLLQLDTSSVISKSSEVSMISQLANYRKILPRLTGTR